MSYADPISITYNAVATNLPRISSSANAGTFRTADSSLAASVSHSYGKTRTRRQLRLDHQKVAADPLVAAQNLRYSMSAYIVIDVPIVGYSVAEAKLVVDALTGFAANATNINKLLGGEQ